MSLTQFIERQEVKSYLNSKFELPQVVESMTTTFIQARTKNYTLVGTAFDYLLRFDLKRRFPKCEVSLKWVAEQSLQHLLNEKCMEILKSKNPSINMPLYLIQANRLIESAKEDYEQYLTDSKLTDALIRDCINLAQLDSIYRSGIAEKNLGQANPEDIEDLRQLLQLSQSKLIPTQICVLNPTFNKASLLVGGADMDVLMDDMLIDIKTTINMKLTSSSFHQIIGYYLLYQIGGINQYMPGSLDIKYLAIYFSRQGVLFKIPLVELFPTKEKLNELVGWMTIV